MEIEQFSVVLKARNLKRTCHFYGEILALPNLRSWDREDSRGASFQAGTAVIEIVGRPHESDPAARDENFDYQGPDHKLSLSVKVPSVEKAYEELQLRDRNIPGGLQTNRDGSLVFTTHDPDGVRITCHQAG